MEPQWKVKEKTLLEMTEGELGELWDVERGKDDLMKYVKEFPNYGESKESSEEYDSICWNCKTKIALTENTKCSQCDYAIRCPKCGECACDKPGSKIKKKHFF
jgi:hypothetical protein